MIKVAVIGALGKMGSEVIKAVTSDEELELVAAIDKFGAGLTAHGNIKIENNLKSALERTQPDIAVDFTEPNSILDHIKTCFEMNVRPIVGTTGLKAEDLKTIEKLSNEKQIGCFIAPNFTIGAVLMMMFAKTAAKYFNNSEIIEFHHNQKKDYPSGTAIKTAEMMSETNKDLSAEKN